MIAREQPKEQCQICLEQFDGDSFNIECHTFHWKCLGEIIRLAIREQKFPIRCPMQGCQTVIELSAIRQIDVSLEQDYCESKLKQHLKTQISLYSFCPTPDCPGIVEFIKAIKQKPKYDKCKDCNLRVCRCNCFYRCLSCQKEYCLTCNAAHTGLSCKQYQHNKRVDLQKNKFIQYLVKEKVKKCPFCNMWVQRTQGCNHMVCSCKQQFCYGCSKSKKDCRCNNNIKPTLDIYPKLEMVYRPRKPSKVTQLVQNYKKMKQDMIALKPTVFVIPI